MNNTPGEIVCQARVFPNTTALVLAPKVMSLERSRLDLSIDGLADSEGSWLSRRSGSKKVVTRGVVHCKPRYVSGLGQGFRSGGSLLFGGTIRTRGTQADRGAFCACTLVHTWKPMNYHVCKGMTDRGVELNYHAFTCRDGLRSRRRWGVEHIQEVRRKKQLFGSYLERVTLTQLNGKTSYPKSYGYVINDCWAGRSRRTEESIQSGWC